MKFSINKYMKIATVPYINLEPTNLPKCPVKNIERGLNRDRLEST